MNRKIIGIVASVVLAALGTVVLVAYVQSAERRALAGERTVEVLVAQADISKGTKAEELAAVVKKELVPAKVQAEGSVVDLIDLEGKVATVDLLAGEQIVAARFQTPEAVAEAAEVEIPEGHQEVTVALEPQRAVGGRIKPGDTVGLFASFSPDLMAYSTHLTLHKLLVTSVQIEASGLATTTPTPPADETTDDDAPEPAPAGQLLVTLAVDAEAAEKVVFAAEHGTIWLSAQGASASEQGTGVQTPETIYR